MWIGFISLPIYFCGGAQLKQMPRYLCCSVSGVLWGALTLLLMGAGWIANPNVNMFVMVTVVVAVCDLFPGSAGAPVGGADVGSRPGPRLDHGSDRRSDPIGFRREKGSRRQLNILNGFGERHPDARDRERVSPAPSVKGKSPAQFCEPRELTRQNGTEKTKRAKMAFLVFLQKRSFLPYPGTNFAGSNAKPPSTAAPPPFLRDKPGHTRLFIPM